MAIAVPPPFPADGFNGAVRLLKDAFDQDRLSLAATHLYGSHDNERLKRIAALGRKLTIPLVATNDVHYHIPERRALQEVLTCIRLGCTRDQAGFALFANAERHIKGSEEMARLFTENPQAILRMLAR